MYGMNDVCDGGDRISGEGSGGFLLNDVTAVTTRDGYKLTASSIQY